MPVWPTCMSLGTYPASTAARDAPIAAPIASATGSKSFLKFSPDCSPRPPEITMRAEASSGRSEVVSSAFSKLDSPAAAGPLIVSTGADPPSCAEANAEIRTVRIFLGSED